MKQYLTFICLVFIFSFAFAQTVPGSYIQVKNSTWDKLDFKPQWVAEHQIKSIQILPPEELSKSTLQVGKKLSYRFDSNGNLLKLIELNNKDTSYVEARSYTEGGIMNWKRREDKLWNKSYKDGYRHNRNKTVFQMKSYEMINKQEDQVMLLHTQQYVYREGNDSVLQAIRFLENQKVVRQQYFLYDGKDRLTDEIMVTSRDDTLKHISYSYDERDNLTRIVTEEGGIVKENRYTYTPLGYPEEIQWKENGAVKGTVSYTYDKEGKLIEMKQTQGPQEEETVRVVEYEMHEGDAAPETVMEAQSMDR